MKAARITSGVVDRVCQLYPHVFIYRVIVPWKWNWGGEVPALLSLDGENKRTSGRVRQKLWLTVSLQKYKWSVTFTTCRQVLLEFEVIVEILWEASYSLKRKDQQSMFTIHH
jgi:hypothetical protein